MRTQENSAEASDWIGHRRLRARSVGLRVAADGEPPACDAVTFHTRISRISHERCSPCHRPSLAAPLPLLTYEDADKRAQPVLVIQTTEPCTIRTVGSGIHGNFSVRVPNYRGSEKPSR